MKAIITVHTDSNEDDVEVFVDKPSHFSKTTSKDSGLLRVLLIAMKCILVEMKRLVFDIPARVIR